MFKSLQDFLSSKSNAFNDKEDINDHDITLAAATLMFEVIRSDGDIDTAELNTMGELLTEHFELEQADVTTMIELARDSSNEAISMQSFTRQICDNWDNEQRLKLLEQLWIIALADSNIDAHERHTVRKIGALLYLNDKQIASSREAAKAQLQSSISHL